MSASAPGKLFLFGEYAVLATGWAVVAGTDRRVFARTRPDTEGYRVEGARFVASDSLPRAAARAAGLDEALVDSLTTDVAQLYHDGVKLGLGSSAASTIASLATLSPGASAPELFDAAFRAHREIQSGRGSGADVASSIYGGLIAYRLVEPQHPFPRLAVSGIAPPLAVKSPAEISTGLSWPDTLSVRPVWLGAPASSSQLIGRVEEALERSPDEITSCLHEIAGVSLEVISCLLSEERGRAEVLLELVGRGDRAMEQLSDASGASIVIDAHRRLREHAARFGAVCKPSGAGGGDFSLIFAPIGTDWAELEATAPEGVYFPDVTLFGPGVAGPREPAP